MIPAYPDADLYVFAATEKRIDFHIRIKPDNAATRAAVEAELRSYLFRDGYPEGALELSRINEAISVATGEYSHVLVAPAADISIAKNELATLGILSWT